MGTPWLLLIMCFNFRMCPLQEELNQLSHLVESTWIAPEGMHRKPRLQQRVDDSSTLTDKFIILWNAQVLSSKKKGNFWQCYFLMAAMDGLSLWRLVVHFIQFPAYHFWCSMWGWLCVQFAQLTVAGSDWWSNSRNSSNSYHASCSPLGACRVLPCVYNVGHFLFHYAGIILWIDGMNFHQAGRNHRRP